MARAVLFLTSNGAGLGHLTRSMAIAARLPDGIQPVFFTLSQALPVVRQQGFLAEFLYSPGYAGSSRSSWNRLFERRLDALFRQYDPAVVVFDGSYPYRGLVNAAARASQRTFVWCRRAMWRPGIGQANLDHSVMFDAVIEPGEFAGSVDRGLTTGITERVTRVPPILLCDPDDALTPADARSRLGLDPRRRAVLVQLGAGNINDVSSVTGMCVDRLRREPDLEIVVAESTIAGTSVSLPSGVRRVRQYPLSPFYPAFDFAVSAAGYNSYHEMIAYGLPCLFVPNTDTALDDQVARARYGQTAGVARSWEHHDRGSLEEALASFLDDSGREAMRTRLAAHRFANGAHDAAAMLTSLAMARDVRAPGAPPRTVEGRGVVPSAREERGAATTAEELPAPAAQSPRPIGAPSDSAPSADAASPAAVRVRRAGGQFFRVLVRALPHEQARVVWRAGDRVRMLRHEAKTWLASKLVGTAMPLPGVEAGSHGLAVLALVWGPTDEELGQQLARIQALQSQLGTFAALIVTDSDAFHVLRAGNAVFEYVPPVTDVERVTPGVAYEDFVGERLQELVDAYRPDRILVLASAGDDEDAPLRALLSPGDGPVSRRRPRRRPRTP